MIDAHTHCYPPEVYADPRAWASTRGETHWAELVAPHNKPSIQAWATPEQMLRDMDVAGIEQSILLGWYWERPATCAWHNQVIANWVAHAPDRFIGFASVNPSADPEQVLEQLEDARSLGLSGVGELHIGVQGFDAQSAGWRSLADFCVQHQWPVNLHATECAGHDHPGSVPTPLNQFVRMAELHPRLKIILAHWGGGLPFFEENPKLKEALRNVYYDCSASPLLYEPSIFRRVIDLVSCHKILFGSDYPLRLFPRQHKQANFETFLRYIEEQAGLNQAELDALFSGNCQRLLGEPCFN